MSKKSRVPKFFVLLYWILDSKSSSWQQILLSSVARRSLAREVPRTNSSSRCSWKMQQGVMGVPMASRFQKYHRMVGWRNFKSSPDDPQLVIALGRDDARLVVMAKK